MCPGRIVATLLTVQKGVMRSRGVQYFLSFFLLLALVLPGGNNMTRQHVGLGTPAHVLTRSVCEEETESEVDPLEQLLACAQPRSSRARNPRHLRVMTRIPPTTTSLPSRPTRPSGCQRLRMRQRLLLIANPPPILSRHHPL